MTAISPTSSSSYPSPLQRLQDELQSEVNSGAISSSDQGALSSALNDISSSVQGDASGGANSSPGDLKSKIDNLIAGEVSSGKLTSDQATELQSVFKTAFADGSGASGGPGVGGAHHHHHGGGHGGSPPADSADSTTDSSANDILQQFLQSLQNAQSASSPASYGATGNASPPGDASSSFSALLIDYQT